MAEPSPSWWKLTFLRRKKSQARVLYELPSEFLNNGSSAVPPTATAAHSEAEAHDPQLEARLERIVDKTTAREGRHVKVSHSGRFKEKKKARAMLADKPEMFEGDPRRAENQKWAVCLRLETYEIREKPSIKTQEWLIRVWNGTSLKFPCWLLLHPL